MASQLILSYQSPSVFNAITEKVTGSCHTPPSKEEKRFRCVTFPLRLEQSRPGSVFYVSFLLHVCLQDRGEDIISTAGADAARRLISVLRYHSGDSIPSAKKHGGARQTRRVRRSTGRSVQGRRKDQSPAGSSEELLCHTRH